MPYYEPPGAQVLHNNPLFVRSHDFAGSSMQGIDQVWGAPELIGIGATAGGGAYLIGSLADLPYALAGAEEDFIAPQKVQALIWQETVPELLVKPCCRAGGASARRKCMPRRSISAPAKNC